MSMRDILKAESQKNLSKSWIKRIIKCNGQDWENGILNSNCDFTWVSRVLQEWEHKNCTLNLGSLTHSKGLGILEQISLYTKPQMRSQCAKSTKKKATFV